MADISVPTSTEAPPSTDVPMTGSDDLAAPTSAPAVDKAPSPAEESKVQDPTEGSGDTQPPTTSEAAGEAQADSADTEMKDAGEPADAPVVPVNGTPVSTAKKVPNSSAKKKSSGVPEHKSRKLNKKKSKPALNVQAEPGDLYFARMKGHQPWPSIVCDESMLPQPILNSRPVTAALPDGTFKKPEFAPGGKREGERSFPVMFLYTNEFAWIVNTELKATTPEECATAPEKAKNKSLVEAYKVAAEGNDLAHFKTVLKEHQDAMQEDADRRADKDAKKSQKGKQKSEAVAEASDPDEMDIDEDAGESKPKTKKRKQSLDASLAEEKPAKTPKTSATQKLKLSTPKNPAEASGKTKSAAKSSAKPKANGKKAKGKASGSDEDHVDTPKGEEKEKPLSPAEAKQKKEQEIRYYRHKLQKGFLSRDTAPGDEEIKSMSTYLTKLETHPDLEGSIIRATKIHKVLKAMIRLNSIPKDEEYNFKTRSHELLTKWNTILAADPAPGAGGEKDDDDKPEDKPEPNGVAKEDKKEATDGTVDESENTENKTVAKAEGVKEAEKPAEKAAEKTVEATTDEPKVEKPAEALKPTADPVEATA